MIGIAAFFYLPAFPETCSFLNQADRVLAVARGKDGIEQGTSLIAGKLHKVTKGASFLF